MTTKREYFCNVCRDRVDDENGVGFSLKACWPKKADENFEDGYPAQHENHLCMKCISAIYNLSVKISDRDAGPGGE